MLKKFINIFSGEFVKKTLQSSLYKFPVFNGGVTNTGFYKYSNQSGPKIIISSRGASAGYVNFCKKPFWAGNSAFSLSSVDEEILENKFLYFQLAKNNSILNVDVYKSGIPSILNDQINKYKIFITSKNEQSKISIFLNLIYEIITLHHRELKLKKLTQNYIFVVFAFSIFRLIKIINNKF